MTRNLLAAGLICLTGVIAAGAVAAAALLGLDWLLDRIAPPSQPAARLAFAMTAPFSVVLFAALVAPAGRLADRVAGGE